MDASVTFTPMTRPSLAPYNPEPVQRLLRQAAERWPGDTAIVDGERRFTFAELDDCSGRLASALVAMGLGKGDIVGILSPNCAEFEIAFFGILKAGATVTTINSGYREREIAYQLQASGAQALIVHHTLADAADLALSGSEQVRHRILIAESTDAAPSFWSLIEAQNGPPPEPSLDPLDDLAALPFSSGTTGLQKGVMLTHANLHTNVRQNLGRPGEEGVVRRGDVMLVHLPLFHIYGMTVLQLSAIAAGATQVMMGRFDMGGMLSLIAEHRVTVLYTVPPVCLGLTLTPLLDEYDVSSLRFLLSGAAPLSGELQTRLAERLGCAVIQGYGLTETSPMTNTDFTDERGRPGTIGPAIPDTEERVVDLETGERDLPPGELGELLVRGPQVMKGYYRQPEATAEVITPDGWFHTGDIASMDEDGYVRVVDRKKELIKYKGFQVAPAELEGLLLEHPGVADVAVIPKADEEAGEVPKAFVVRKADAEPSEGELMAFVAERVATFKQLGEVEFIDAIPKNASGKLLRRVLIEQERAREA